MVFIIIIVLLLFIFKNRILDFINHNQYLRNTPVSHVIGSDFEDFVENIIFPDKKYILVEKTHGFFQNQIRFVESSLNPDFKFRCRSTKREFYVEAKFRNSLDKNGMLAWCSSYEQFNRYRLINNITPIYIVIGFCGLPYEPDHIFFIPFTEIKYISLYPSQFNKYSFKPI